MPKLSYDTVMKVLKPQFRELKESVEKNKLSSSWVDAQPIITNKTTFVSSKNNNGNGFTYKSDCENFEGYYITDGYGGVKCSLVNSALPGTVFDMFCSKENCKECPINDNKGLALRDAENDFLRSLE